MQYFVLHERFKRIDNGDNQNSKLPAPARLGYKEQ